MPAFLPKESFTDLEGTGPALPLFIDKGVRKLRLTGSGASGAQDIMHLISGFRAIWKSGALDRRPHHERIRSFPFADRRRSAGYAVSAMSLDTLDPEKFHQIHPLGRSRDSGDYRAAQRAGIPH